MRASGVLMLKVACGLVESAARSWALAGISVSSMTHSHHGWKLRIPTHRRRPRSGSSATFSGARTSFTIYHDPLC